MLPSRLVTAALSLSLCLPQLARAATPAPASAPTPPRPATAQAAPAPNDAPPTAAAPTPDDAAAPTPNDLDAPTPDDAAAPTPTAAAADATAPASAAPASLGAAPVPPPVPAGMVRVHLVGEGRGAQELMLYRDTGGAFGTAGSVTISATSWSNVCNAPCGVTLDTIGGSYFVNRAGDGPGLRSKPVTFGGRSGDVTLHVRTGSKAAFITGFMLAPFGFGAVAGGAVVLPYGIKHHDHKNTVVGAATISAGVVAAILGIALAVRGRNRVRVVPGQPG